MFNRDTSQNLYATIPANAIAAIEDTKKYGSPCGRSLNRAEGSSQVMIDRIVTLYYRT